MDSAKITKKDIKHLKKLARVELVAQEGESRHGRGEHETEALAEDLERILGFVEQLKEVDISNVSEMTHAADLKNIFRKDDNPQRFNETLLGRLISAFPEKEKTYLKVKAVLKK